MDKILIFLFCQRHRMMKPRYVIPWGWDLICPNNSSPSTEVWYFVGFCFYFCSFWFKIHPLWVSKKNFFNVICLSYQILSLHKLGLWFISLQGKPCEGRDFVKLFTADIEIITHVGRQSLLVQWISQGFSTLATIDILFDSLLQAAVFPIEGCWTTSLASTL